jgi:hypothetical protein
MYLVPLCLQEMPTKQIDRAVCQFLDSLSFPFMSGELSYEPK